MRIAYKKMWLILFLTLMLFFHHPAFGPHPFQRKSQDPVVLQSSHYINGHFANEHPTPQFTGKNSSGLSALWNFLTDRTTERKPKKCVEIEKNDLSTLPLDKDWFVWFGHSSYLFALGGQKILVDPVLQLEFPASVMLKPFKGTDKYHPADLPEIDVLVITHEHWDHMDYATLRDIREKVHHVICPLGIGAYLRYWGYADEIITEMDWYQQTFISAPKTELSVTCLPTRHFSNRLFGANQTLWASFMIENGDRRVYIGGDGGYDDRFSRIQQMFPSISLAVLENGQYNPNWAYIHTLPEYLEKAMEDLQAENYITVHHDKFSLAPHAWDEPDKTVATLRAKHPDWSILDQPLGSVIYY